MKFKTYDCGTRFAIAYSEDGQRHVRTFVIPPELRPHFAARFG